MSFPIFYLQYMYDLLMNLLEEKGMSNAFAEKLSDVATDYEHDLYVKFLENMKLFVNSKWSVWIKNNEIQNVVSLFISIL